jgi:hypothetical protein
MATAMIKGANNSMEKATVRKINPNLGELIAAAGELAFVFSENDQEAYDLARLALVEFIKNSAHALDSDKEFEALTTPSQRLH